MVAACVRREVVGDFVVLFFLVVLLLDRPAVRGGVHTVVVGIIRRK